MKELQKPDVISIAERKEGPSPSKFLEMAIKRY
jgi:hypothetical protein